MMIAEHPNDLVRDQYVMKLSRAGSTSTPTGCAELSSTPARVRTDKGRNRRDHPMSPAASIVASSTRCAGRCTRPS